MLTTPDAAWSLDTGILMYAMAADSPALKRQVALKLMAQLFRHPQGGLVVQVVSEYLSLVFGKRLAQPEFALETVQLWSRMLRILDASAAAHQKAWALAAAHKYPVWDALTIAICAEHGIKALYSENAGSLKRPLGVHIINPFAETE